MNINVNDLDLGYTQCEELNTLSSTDGEKLISDLGTDITNLKANWKGSDAAVHINNLIKVYEAMVAIVTDAKATTAQAGAAISAIQNVRRANGGSGNVGAALPANAPESMAIQAPEETTEYYCSPSAKTDYSQLVDICTNFVNFRNKFQDQKDALLANWTAGANRENAVKTFDEFTNNTETYNKYLTSARDNLEIAVNNIAALN